ncbi:hypothetical protein [Cupriavidus pauculus]|uniref:hypothetical protein n=1 Tax=Cupriavidus pauculus TaxID=82633 RepID=UPI001FD0D4D8|nr:hypothetical protein [Cupriavidus pauculus]
MTDHIARQAGITEALHYLQMGIANLELGNGVHMIDFRNAERAILAAHSADARNREAVAMQVLREIIAHDDAWEKETQTSRVSTSRADEYLAEFMALKDKARALLAAPAAAATTEAHDQCFDCNAPLRKGQVCGCARHPTKGDDQVWYANAKATPAPAAQADQVSLHVGGEHFVFGSPEATALVQEALYRQQSVTPAVPAVNESALTAAVWQRICELPDRNSPEGEPDACVLTLREFSGCMANALEDLNLLPPQGITPPPECTCPSGNGSLRHPCPAHPADAASDPLRAVVQAAVDLMEAREWAEHFAECHAPGDELASRLEACITTLHNEAYGGEDRADPASEADDHDEFARAVAEMEDCGESSAPYSKFMQWVARGLLECSRFELTQAGRDFIQRERPQGAGNAD